MDVFNLFAKLGLDDSGYKEGLGAAKEEASSFGEKLKSGLGTAAKISGAAITASTAALAGFSKEAVSVGAAFDSSMSQVAATMGKSMEELNSTVATTQIGTDSFTGTLREFAQYMGSTTAFSASQAADALNYMALAGYDAQTSMDMLPNVLNLAAAGGIELGRASDMVTDAASALGLSLDETAELVDKMAQASSKSNTSVSQLGDAILVVGGTAKNLAGGTTELSTALGILADNGIKGAEGGTALRNIILSLSAPTDKAAETMKALGIEAYDAEGNLRPLNEIFGDMNAVLSTMNQGEQTNVLNTLFNKVDLKSVNALLANTNQGFLDISGAIQKAGVDWSKYNGYMSETGELDKDIMADLLWNINELGTSAEELQEYLHWEFDIEDEDAWAIVNSITDAVKESGSRWDELSGYIDEAAGSAQAMANTQLDNLQGDITLMKSALEGAQIVISDALTPALRDFVQLGADGISSVAAAFQENGLSGAMDAFGVVLSDGLNMVIEMLPQAVDAGMQLLGALGQGIIDNLPQIVESAVQVVGAVVSSIAAAAPELLESGANALSDLTDGILSGIPRMVDRLPQVINGFLDYVTESLPKILEKGSELLLKLATGIINAIPQLVSMLPEIITSIVNFLLESTPKILETGAYIILELGNAMIDAIPGLRRVTDEVESMFKAAWGAIKAIWDHVGPYFSYVWEQIKNCFSTVSKVLSEYFSAAWKNIKLVWDSATGYFKTIWDNIKLTFSVVENVLKGNFKAAWDGIKSIFSNWVSFFKMLFENMIGIFSNVGEAFENIGKSIVEGVWNGIKNMSSWLKEKVSGFFSGIVDGVKDLLGIHSPSTVFSGIGENMALGLGKGWEREYDGIRRSIEGDMRFQTATVDLSASGMGMAQRQVSGASGAAEGPAQPIILQVTLDGRVIGETSYNYIRDRRKAAFA